jgi:hypothetical protein
MAATRARGRAARTSSEPEAGPPRSDAYTGILAISLLAMIVGCVLLYMDYSDYAAAGGNKPPPVPTRPAAPQGGQPAAPPVLPAGGGAQGNPMP